MDSSNDHRPYSPIHKLENRQTVSKLLTHNSTCPSRTDNPCPTYTISIDKASNRVATSNITEMKPIVNQHLKKTKNETVLQNIGKLG